MCQAFLQELEDAHMSLGLKPNFNISHSQEVLSMYMCEALYKSMSQHTLIKSVYMLSHITVEETGHHHPAQACALGCHDSPTTVPSAEGSTSTHTCHMCLRKHRCQLMSCCLSYEVHIKLAWIPAFSKVFVTSWWLTLLSSNFLILFIYLFS